MKKSIFLSIFGILCASFLGFFVITKVNQKEALPEVIYYVPHQDDELLTFGASIYDHIVKGHDVYVVLLTDGAASYVRDVLNMSEEEFTEARNREFDAAIEVLGVPLEHVEKKGYPDGGLLVEQVEEIIKEYHTRFPRAHHKATSYLDPHPDHASAGLALKNLMDKGLIENGQFYFGYSYTPEGVEIKEDDYDESYYPVIIAASLEYKIEDSESGRYGIGWRSVGKAFRLLEEDPISRYHEY